MFANTITLFRLLLTFIVIAMLGRHPALDTTLIATIPIIFILDAVDGIVARKLNETSKLGEVLDTVADRLIENIFWIYFTAVGIIPVWMPITVMTRGFLTDALQHVYGSNKSRWAHALTRSRISRGLYGAVKMLAFMSIASTTTFINPTLEKVSLSLAIIAVGFCLIRALPVFVQACKVAGKKKTQEKHFFSVSQNAEELTRTPQVSKKAIR